MHLASIQETMEEVKRVQIASVIAALWNLDDQQLAAQVQGMLHFPYLNYAAIRDGDKVIAEAGASKAREVIAREFPLDRYHDGRKTALGVLYLQADSTKVIQDVLGRISVIFLFQAATVAVTAFLLFMLFKGLVTRHLSVAAHYFRTFDIDRMNVPLRLDKKQSDDEIDTLVHSFNSMREHLAEAYRRQISAQRKVEESEERYRVLFESSGEAILLFHHDRFVGCNKKTEQMFGLNREEILEASVRDISPPCQPDGKDSEDKASEKINAALAGESQLFEWVHLRADGVAFDAEVSLNRIVLGSETLVQGLIRDISARKQMEKDLKEEKEFTDAAINTMRGAFFVKDQKGRYVRWNRQVTAALGVRDEQMGSVDDLSRIHPEDRERMASKMAEVFEKGYAQGEARAVINEKVRHFFFFGRRMHIGKKAYLVGSGIDVTERKEAERERTELESQLQQAQKMEAIGTLAGGIAHDFNNILTAIIGYGELMQHFQIDAAHPARSNLEEVLKAGYRAKDLVRQILAFSRLAEQEKKPVVLASVISETLKFLRATLPSTIEIRHSLKGKDAKVLADATQMHQVLMNLCTNAAHAMGEGGGVLEIGLDRLDPGLQGADSFKNPAEGPHLKLTVRDTGHGMAPQIMERIFDPYFTTKKRGDGTGLGLSLVHGIVKNHGGRIAVDSEPGSGASFSIYLPVLAENGMQLPDETSEPVPSGTECVLFVDDEAPIVDMARIILENLGYEVVGATDPLEALTTFLAAPDRFHLVITDLTMPRMTGAELIEKLTSIRPGIPVILSSGFGLSAAREKIEALGVRRFIDKPLSVSRLAQAVRQALDSDE